MAAVWPEAVEQFNAYYGIASPCIYTHKDSEGNSVIRITFSTDGTRAGCVLGSAGFNIALFYYVYKLPPYVFKHLPTLLVKV